MTPDQAKQLIALHEADVDAAIRYALNPNRDAASVHTDAAEAFHRYVNSLTDRSES
jgi:hypothetical protein